MAKQKGNRVLAGTWAEIWIDGVHIFDCYKISAKISANREDVQIGIDIDIDSKLTGLKGEGEYAVKKVYSRHQATFEAWARGEDPRAQIITKLAYDLMFYVMESEISRVFKDTPEKITELVCGELGVPFLSAAKTGIQVYYPCLGKPGYEAIIAAYTYASRQNGKKYIPLMKKDSLRVIQKGLSSGVVLNGDFNLKDANYKTTLTKLVNKVIIVDEKGNKVGLVEDADSQKKYGAIQKIYKKEKDVDATAAAKNLLMGIDKSATAKALSDYKCLSGYSVYIREPITGLIGKFYVESDTHTFKNAEESMDLSLAFVNLMDEREIETEKKEAEASA